MEHYIVDTGQLDGPFNKIAQLKNIFNCNTVYVDKVVITNFNALEDVQVVIVKNLDDAGDGAVARKGISTDLSNSCPSKSTLYYNDAYNGAFSPSDIIFQTVAKSGNTVLEFDDPIIMRPGNSLSVVLNIDGATGYSASIRFEFDESSSCACCYCC